MEETEIEMEIEIDHLFESSQPTTMESMELLENDSSSPPLPPITTTIELLEDNSLPSSPSSSSPTITTAIELLENNNPITVPKTPTNTHATTKKLETSSKSKQEESIEEKYPYKWQCPICFDLLCKPVTFPCCKNCVCLECFELGVHVTSSNCPLCRKRIAGFSRRTANKIDLVLWNEILECCPLLAKQRQNGESLPENCMKIEHHHEAHIVPPKDGELKLYWDSTRCAVRKQQEELATAATLQFLQQDEEYLDFQRREQERIAKEIQNDEELAKRLAVLEETNTPHKSFQKKNKGLLLQSNKTYRKKTFGLQEYPKKRILSPKPKHFWNVKKDSQFWICRQCTLKNRDIWLRCQACESVRTGDTFSSLQESKSSSNTATTVLN